MIAQLGICLVFPLIALIALAMLRIEGRTPLLTIIQVVTGAATGILLLLPMLLMAIIAFRPDRTAELTVTLNDIAWLLFLTPIAPFMIQNIAIGTAILTDSRAVLPRWVGYLNFWAAAAFIPDVLAVFLLPRLRRVPHRDGRGVAVGEPGGNPGPWTNAAVS
ncbi:hypothetical protein MycrhDRAFT_1698 [Mycolicibacterium rhodesiae JS60]|nr:hypothetical protein MycrhDRAFT_1698 [Mycolicibacterium rhodesiae JS60]